MALDIYFIEDITNTVNALEMAALYQERTDFRAGRTGGTQGGEVKR